MNSMTEQEQAAAAAGWTIKVQVMAIPAMMSSSSGARWQKGWRGGLVRVKNQVAHWQCLHRHQTRDHAWNCGRAAVKALLES